MTFFWILWGIDAVVALIALYFFFVGLGDGSVSSFNGTMWMGLLAGLAVVLLGSLWLKSHDYLLLAKILLAVVAVPATLYGLMILTMVFGGGRWN